MPTRSEAEEHLRIIRSLMEKATIYRAISAPTALVGGLCSVLFGAWLHFRWRSLPRWREADEFDKLFICGWLGVLAVTCAANTWFLWREARRRGEPFISAGMRQALKCLVPPMLCGGVAAFWFAGISGSYMILFLPVMWMISYGLALLATAPFAPRSIPRLGWVFLLAGLVMTHAHWWFGQIPFFGKGDHIPTAANLLMVATFGAFHLIYAAFTWPRTASQSDPGSMP